MSEETCFFCIVCRRNLKQSRSVRGNVRLKHSNRLLSDAVADILDKTILVSKVCFRCYRLVLGIDFHQNELQRLTKSFIKVFNEGKELDVIYDVPALSKGDCSTSGIIESKFIHGEIPLPGENVTSNVGHDLVYHESTVCDDAKDTYSDLDSIKVEFLAEDLTDAIPFVPSELDKPEEIILKEPYTNVNHGASTINVRETNESKNDLNRTSNSKRRSRMPKKFDDYDYYSATETLIPSQDEHDVRTHPDDSSRTRTPMYCSLCEHTFKTKKAYNCHECLKREKEIIYECKGCSVNFTVRRHYIKHAEVCYKNVPVKCHVCLTKLPSAAYLPRHIEAFHQGPTVNQKTTLCEHCGRGFSRKEALERHQAKAHGLAHGIHQCPQCGRIFLHTALLAEHMRAHKGYMCGVCKKVFSCMSNLNLHTKAHHQKVSSYHCSTCKKSWKFHASYTYHMRKVHGSSHLKCMNCKNVFQSPKKLENHKKLCVVHADKTKTSSDEAEENLRLHEQSGKLHEVPKTVNQEAEQPQSEIDEAHISSHARTVKSQEASVKTIKRSARLTNKERSLSQPQRSNIKKCVNARKAGDAAARVATLRQDGEATEKLMVVPSASHVKESQVLYEVKEKECVVPSDDDIIVETMDDLTNDCHYVILVEEGEDAIE